MKNRKTYKPKLEGQCGSGGGDGGGDVGNIGRQRKRNYEGANEKQNTSDRDGHKKNGRKREKREIEKRENKEKKNTKNCL